MELLNVKNGQPYQQPLEIYAVNGAIKPQSGIAVITKGSAAAMTLAAPAENGYRLTIHSTTAFAHTVTVAGGIAGAGTGADVGTFGAAAGNGVELFSYNGAWHVVPGTNLNVTFA